MISTYMLFFTLTISFATTSFIPAFTSAMIAEQLTEKVNREKLYII